MIIMKNNSLRLSKEFSILQKKNRDLYDIINDLYYFCQDKFKKDIVVTMILRTQEEQDEIYKGTTRGSREYDKNPWKSFHQFYLAVDIRSNIFTPEEIKIIENYLNTKYNGINQRPVTAKCHEVIKADGTRLGDHFHIEFQGKQ